MPQKRSLTSKHRETNIRIGRRLDTLETAVSRKLILFYNKKLKPLAGLYPIDVLRRKYDPEVQSIIRKAVQNAYNEGNNEVGNQINNHVPEFEIFLSGNDLNNIKKVTEKFDTAFWNKSNKLLLREAGFDKKTVNDKPVEKGKLDHEAALIGLSVGLTFAAFNLATMTKVSDTVGAASPFPLVPLTAEDLGADLTGGEGIPIPEELAGQIDITATLTQLGGKVIFLTAEDARVDPVICEPWNRTVFDPIEDLDIPQPPLHDWCLMPDTPCESPSGIITGLRTWYNGPIIELVISNGRRISVTPNHMFLTPYGFAAADLLSEGDDIVCSSGFKASSINPYDNGNPVTIEKIFNSLSKRFGMITKRMPTTAEYLHGDSRFCNGNIDIISTNCLLGNDVLYPSLLQHADKNLFYLTTGSAPFLNQSYFAKVLKCLAFAADSTMGRFRQSSSFFGGRVRHTQKHGFTSVSRSDTDRLQSSNYGVPTDLKNLGNLVNRFSSYISILEITQVNVFSYVGFTYDLSTPATLYVGNGSIISNCRCRLIPIVEESESLI